LVSKSPEIRFGVVDYFGFGEPCAWAPGEAWVVREGGNSWERVNSAVVGMDGRVLSDAEFKARFPSLPALPSNAFHSGLAASEAAK
jgi:hypothetical protein